MMYKDIRPGDMIRWDDDACLVIEVKIEKDDQVNIVVMKMPPAEKAGSLCNVWFFETTIITGDVYRDGVLINSWNSNEI